MITLFVAVMGVHNYFRFGQPGLDGTKPTIVKATLEAYNLVNKGYNVSYDE